MDEHEVQVLSTRKFYPRTFASALSCAKSESTLSDPTNEANNQISPPQNAVQELAALDRITYGNDELTALVADVRLALIAISDHEAGLYSQALENWEIALTKVEPDLRPNFIVGWIRTWLESEKKIASPEEAAKSILTQIHKRPIERSFQAENIAQEQLLVQFLINRDILYKVKKRQMNWKDSYWPTSLATEFSKIKVIASFDKACKKLSSSSALTFRESFESQDDLEKKLSVGLALTCAGDSDLATKELQNFLDLPTPDDSEKALLAKVFAVELLSFLYRDIGDRSGIALNYHNMVQQYQVLIEKGTWTQAQKNQLEYTLSDREIWAARYLSLANEYTLAEKHGSSAVERLRRLQAKTASLTQLQRRNFASLFAEAFHTMAYRVAYELGQYEKIEDFIKQGEKVPGLGDSWRRTFVWYKGLNQYSLGNPEAAVMYWQELLNRLPEKHPMLPQILYWLSRAYSDTEQPEKVRELVTRLRSDFPTDFYTIVAARDLDTTISVSSEQMGLYLAAFGEQGVPRLKPAEPPFLGIGPNRNSLQRGEVLADAGIKRFAAPLVKNLSREVRKKLKVTSTQLPYFIWLLNLQTKVGEHHQSISLTYELTKSFPTLRYAYPEIINTDYPLPFQDLFEAAADQAGIEKSLIYAIARQETAFRPAVRSPAGALGLMQLVEHTGSRMAQLIGLELENIEETLIDPRYNLRAGATYLSVLTKRYKGSLPATIAAYNAGEYAVDAWIERRKAKDEMLWIELIPFGETKSYVKNVWRNMEIYRGLKGSPARFPEPSKEIAASAKSEHSKT